MKWKLNLGSNLLREDRAFFKVWAPLQNQLHLKILKDQFPNPLKMQKDPEGYFFLEVEHVKEGDQYYYITDSGDLRPDPVSRFLPVSVHGPSAIMKSNDFKWTDYDWKCMNLEDLIFYECHIGTFTHQGTFQAAQEKLAYLKKLGITCLEIMPVAQFPGKWNWGYDGASLYATQNSYGGPKGLKTLIDACHKEGIAVCLDVVYNHFGPEGTYLGEFGHYYSPKYKNPWGNAINVDGPYSDHVRNFLIQNALFWIDEFHIDVLRLDAIHGIYDLSTYPFLCELNDTVVEYAKNENRIVHIIAESDLNDSRVIREKGEGGYGLSGTWCDDFHHSLQVAFTHQKDDYYLDFNGLDHLSYSLKNAYVYDGKYSSYRKRKHGNYCADLPPEKFVVCIQNHDQIGNRFEGNRLSSLISFEASKVAACALIFARYIPLIFMGQEYSEETPFQYFINYEDQKLQQDVFNARKEEFGGKAPDIGENAYQRSKLSWKQTAQQQAIFKLYCDLIALRKAHMPQQNLASIHVYQSAEDEWLAWEFLTKADQWVAIIANFSKKANTIDNPFKQIKKGECLLSTDSKEYLGKESMYCEKNHFFMPPESACFLI